MGGDWRPAGGNMPVPIQQAQGTRGGGGYQQANTPWSQQWGVQPGGGNGGQANGGFYQGGQQNNQMWGGPAVGSGTNTNTGILSSAAWLAKDKAGSQWTAQGMTHPDGSSYQDYLTNMGAGSEMTDPKGAQQYVDYNAYNTQGRAYDAYRQSVDKTMGWNQPIQQGAGGGGVQWGTLPTPGGGVQMAPGYGGSVQGGGGGGYTPSGIGFNALTQYGGSVYGQPEGGMQYGGNMGLNGNINTPIYQGSNYGGAVGYAAGSGGGSGGFGGGGGAGSGGGYGYGGGAGGSGGVAREPYPTRTSPNGPDDLTRANLAIQDQSNSRETAALEEAMAKRGLNQSGAVTSAMGNLSLQQGLARNQLLGQGSRDARDYNLATYGQDQTGWGQKQGANEFDASNSLNWFKANQDAITQQQRNAIMAQQAAKAQQGGALNWMVTA